LKKLKNKSELSSTETEINLPYVMLQLQDQNTVKLSRSKFEQLTDALVKRSMAPVAKALNAGLSVSDIDK
jgi:molecular chaperone DnaK